MEHKLVEIDYQDIITSYDFYYGFDLNNPKETMNNLHNYIDLNFNDIAYINEKKYYLQLKADDSIIVIKSSNIFDRINIPMKLDLNKNRYDYCQISSLSTIGYFSKGFKTLDYQYLSKLNLYLKRSFSDSIFIPVYGKDSFDNQQSIATYKYSESEVSLLCSRNFDKESLRTIQDSLYFYLTHDQVDFDYALIPIGKSL